VSAARSLRKQEARYSAMLGAAAMSISTVSCMPCPLLRLHAPARRVTRAETAHHAAAAEAAVTHVSLTASSEHRPSTCRSCPQSLRPCRPQGTARGQPQRPRLGATSEPSTLGHLHGRPPSPAGARIGVICSYIMLTTNYTKLLSMSPQPRLQPPPTSLLANEKALTCAQFSESPLSTYCCTIPSADRPS
jgi:hypothetical protein